MQPLLDVHEIMKNCHCRCLHCGLSGEGRWQAACITGVHGSDGENNRNGDCLSKKKGWTREKERGNLMMGLFLMLSYFVIVF
jgi:hypothetical protein